MADSTRPQSTRPAEHGPEPRRSESEARDRAVSSMVSASLLAVLGTLIFAWALRSPNTPWLFAVGALPWLAGVVMFARALWRYTHL